MGILWGCMTGDSDLGIFCEFYHKYFEFLGNSLEILWEFFGNSLGILWEFFSLRILWGCMAGGSDLGIFCEYFENSTFNSF